MGYAREAELLYDSARTRASVGARSGICVDRTVLFSSPELTVDVVVSTNRDRLQCLHGQVIRQTEGRPVSGAYVHVEEDEPPVTTDEYGQFNLSRVDGEERHVLLIRTKGHDIVCVIPSPDAAPEVIR